MDDEDEEEDKEVNSDQPNDQIEHRKLSVNKSSAPKHVPPSRPKKKKAFLAQEIDFSDLQADSAALKKSPENMRTEAHVSRIPSFPNKVSSRAAADTKSPRINAATRSVLSEPHPNVYCKWVPSQRKNSPRFIRAARRNARAEALC